MKTKDSMIYIGGGGHPHTGSDETRLDEISSDETGATKWRPPGIGQFRQ